MPVKVLERLKSEAKERENKLEQLPNTTERQAALYAERKRQFGRLDDALDMCTHGPTWLKNPAIAAIVAEALLYRDGKVYELDCFTIMSNHVHTVFAPLKDETGTSYG